MFLTSCTSPSASPKRGLILALAVPLVLLPLIWTAVAWPQDQPAATPTALTCAEIEQFLRSAKIGAQKTTAKGVTLPKQAILDDGKIKHQAGIQTIHESKTSFTGFSGTELNFKDWWEFNVAGYELAKILELNMVPPYVARKVGGNFASVTWWIDGMLEVDRMKRKINPPDPDRWNLQMYAVRVFNQLIHNMDANLTNFVITPNWDIWIFDFSRAFRVHKELQNPKDLVKCDRKLLAKLRELNKPLLQEKLKRYLTDMEIDGLLARRDKIVKFFDDEIAKKGEGAVLFDLQRSGRPCSVEL